MKSKQAFAVMTNTDLTEGRGKTYIEAFCETEAVAQRIGAKGYVMGDHALSNQSFYTKSAASGMAPLMWSNPLALMRRGKL